jgi:hypothetical protein
VLYSRFSRRIKKNEYTTRKAMENLGISFYNGWGLHKFSSFAAVRPQSAHMNCASFTSGLNLSSGTLSSVISLQMCFSCPAWEPFFGAALAGAASAGAAFAGAALAGAAFVVFFPIGIILIPISILRRDG